MPPITVEALREKKKQGKDLFSRKEALRLAQFRKALQRVCTQIKRTGTGRDVKLAGPLEEFNEAVFQVMKDPAAPENREKIEDGLDKLASLGDYLGAKAPGKDYSNVLDQLLGAAAEYGGMQEQLDIQNGLQAVNEVCELGIPMDRILEGEIVQSGPGERQAREQRRKERLKQREEQKELLRERQDARKNAELRRQQKRALEQKALEAQEEAEERKQKEKNDRERLEAQKSREQKEKEAAQRRQKEIETELRHQADFRRAIETGVRQYRDPKATPEMKKISMANAAAFQLELERVGDSGKTPIDPERVKRSIHDFFHSAEFQIAEKNGQLDALTALEPKEIAERIARRGREIAAIHPEGGEKDRRRARALAEKLSRTWRIKSNSPEFNAACAAMQGYAEKEGPVSREENYLAAETVQRYVTKNIRRAESETGRKRMALSLAFLKQTMTKDAFRAYCAALNGQRGVVPKPGPEGKLVYDRTDPRGIFPEEIGTMDEIYEETKERIGADFRTGGKKPGEREMAMLTAVAALRRRAGAEGGSRCLDKKALEAEIARVRQDPRFRSAMEKDSAETLVDRAWYHGADDLESYAKAAPEPYVRQEAGLQGPAVG